MFLRSKTNILIVFRTTAPPITGTDSSSENRAAESLSRPSCRAMVIVTPLREAPGISAATWATPINIACLAVRFDQSYSVPSLQSMWLTGCRSAQYNQPAKKTLASATVIASRRTDGDKTSIINPTKITGKLERIIRPIRRR